MCLEHCIQTCTNALQFAVLNYYVTMYILLNTTQWGLENPFVLFILRSTIVSGPLDETGLDGNCVSVSLTTSGGQWRSAGAGLVTTNWKTHMESENPQFERENHCHLPKLFGFHVSLRGSRCFGILQAFLGWIWKCSERREDMQGHFERILPKMTLLRFAKATLVNLYDLTKIWCCSVLIHAILYLDLARTTSHYGLPGRWWHLMF